MSNAANIMSMSAGSLPTLWRIKSSYTGELVLFNSQSSNIYGIAFKVDDGTKMYLLSQYPSAQVYQYTLSTPWDITTATYDSVAFNHSRSDSRRIEFKPDGTAFYIIERSGDRVYQYECSTAWDLSTASSGSGYSFYVGSQDVNPEGLSFKPDGTMMYMAGTQYSRVFQYELSTPWRVDTASYTNKNVYLGSYSYSSNERECNFNPDGTILYAGRTSQSKLIAWNLSVPWDVSTASYGGSSAEIQTAVGGGYGVFKPDATALYSPYGSIAVYQDT